MENETVQFQLGQMTAQLSAMYNTIANMATTIQKMEERQQKTENNVTTLMVKMGFVAVIAGGVGSTIITLILKRF